MFKAKVTFDLDPYLRSMSQVGKLMLHVFYCLFILFRLAALNPTGMDSNVFITQHHTVLCPILCPKLACLTVKSYSCLTALFRPRVDYIGK